jgi:hypothetical protein
VLRRKGATDMGFFEWMFNIGLLGLAYLSSFLLLVVGLPVCLHHRRHVLALRGTHAKELACLRERLDATEKRCVKLEAQIVDLHVQLADETRQLDKKLSSMLPDSSSEPPDARDNPARRASAR